MVSDREFRPNISTGFTIYEIHSYALHVIDYLVPSFRQPQEVDISEVAIKRCQRRKWVTCPDRFSRRGNP